MTADIPAVKINVLGKDVSVDLDDPELPEEVKNGYFESGGYPYQKKMKRSKYERGLKQLQLELVKFQKDMRKTGKRTVIVFEGRDAAGKGGTINRFREYLNPRHARVVALSKPSDTELGQWYFQRYVKHLPTDGELVMFDRSWYNRAGVEPVMGFCTPEQHQHFLDEAPEFEHMLVREGILFFKFWLNIGQAMQIKRFHDRRHDPLKAWKLSPIDIKALNKWDDYTAARNTMLEKTDTEHGQWIVVRSNDKRRARINAICQFLNRVDYEEKDQSAIGEPDDLVLGRGLSFLNEFGA